MSLIPEAVARLAEALIFAAEQPVSAAALSRHVGPEVDVTELIDVLTARHAGMGFHLVAVGGGWRFQTAPDLSLSLQSAQAQDKRIPRVAMEVLTLIAYEQPTTRAEIEASRDTAVSQKTLDLLLELNLIRSLGRRAGVGRPMLWGTTDHFLSLFGLQGLDDLPGFGTPLLAPEPTG